MIDFHKVWIEQCQAALDIQEGLGTTEALGYLIGEKLLRFVQTSDTHPEFAEELPLFVEEIKRIFQPWEIRNYLDSIRHVDPYGQACTEEEYELMKEMGMEENDVVASAEGVILFERIRELFL